MKKINEGRIGISNSPERYPETNRDLIKNKATVYFDIPEENGDSLNIHSINPNVSDSNYDFTSLKTSRSILKPSGTVHIPRHKITPIISSSLKLRPNNKVKSELFEYQEERANE